MVRSSGWVVPCIAGLLRSSSAAEVDVPGYDEALWTRSCFDTFDGNMPNYKQCDSRWKCFPYTGQTGFSTCNTTTCEDDSVTNTICSSGCGITSSAMVLSYYGRKVAPPDVATYFVSQGFRNDLTKITGATCNGVSHEAICAGAKHWGLGCDETSSFEVLDKWLQEGPVIAHVRHRPSTPDGSCKFTTGGHYIVVAGKKNDQGRYTISDPNSCADERAHGTEEELSVACQLVGFVRAHDARHGQPITV